MAEAKTKYIQLASILGSGLIGALLGKWIGMPIPFLLGSMATSAMLSLGYFASTGTRLWFPVKLRHVFIAVIGTMIGTTFNSDVLKAVPDFAITLTAMMVFVAIAQVVNYTIFARIGRFDSVTAKYAAMPGGLVEAVSLGEKAGGDVEALSLQHFVRLILVIVSIPMLFQLITGETVGSAAGETLQRAPAEWQDWLLFLIIVPVGIFIGGRLKLPASHLIGPLLLTAILQGSGVIDLNGPGILVNLAQLVVGSALGSNFARSTPRRLGGAFLLGGLSVGATLIIASGFALVLDRLVPMPFEALLISFAPGGVTEMSLVSLSLGVAPVLVTTHHLFRIVFTVTVAGILTSRAERVGKGG
ncbi:AbrB family transcriptional regulator [Cognatishimia sp. SS12]|uniref:AbrB family transcriptional regulator n=1 Tax=Cognatishimia sp. SS12 TaxID=2979465 RepID=UPI00232B52C1|nr:AbrB family transcriptional regulator [Cognatishimia sp. SS12]MDC0739541.1 AbrB family transcriptional regulator [Cognatishimia sp. SS12]